MVIAAVDVSRLKDQDTKGLPPDIWCPKVSKVKERHLFGNLLCTCVNARSKYVSEIERSAVFRVIAGLLRELSGRTLFLQFLQVRVVFIDLFCWILSSNKKTNCE
ncbi:hypothetical protein AVEN_156590-1 [Araneus ventricosus]|uniref:Uncharacterized protein n=1 Tax=Araneus ventricosus TaxID=182803 RepID=A0A4Y2ETH1_ARAVE|nr:hypothetical protein AVEN_156590-1 [Araneus ventricosus]